MILTKQIRLDLPTTTFFVQINDYGKWEASFQISIKPQEIVLTFASWNGKFNEEVINSALHDPVWLMFTMWLAHFE